MAWLRFEQIHGARNHRHERLRVQNWQCRRDAHSRASQGGVVQTEHEGKHCATVGHHARTSQYQGAHTRTSRLGGRAAKSILPRGSHFGIDVKHGSSNNNYYTATIGYGSFFSSLLD